MDPAPPPPPHSPDVPGTVTAQVAAARSAAQQVVPEQIGASASPDDDSTPPEPAPAPNSPRSRTPAFRWRWRSVQRLPITLMLASLLAGLGIVQLSFQLGLMTYRSVTWTQETRATQSRVKGLEEDVQVLQDAQRSANDPNYLEQLARCQGFVGANETVVVAPNAPATPSDNCDVRRLP